MTLTLEETMNYLGEQLDLNILDFTDNEESILYKCFELICQDIRILQNEQQSIESILTKDQTYNIDIIQKTIFILNEQFLTKGLSSTRITFIKSMLEFIFNWNNNILKDKKITSSCSILYQSIDLVQYVNKTIEVLQKTISTYQDLKSWLPPSFELTKTYLDELLKVNKQNNNETKLI